jgi:hypothetical protein
MVHTKCFVLSLPDAQGWTHLARISAGSKDVVKLFEVFFSASIWIATYRGGMSVTSKVKCDPKGPPQLDFN